MDILGVGAAELLIIGLLILIVAGPKRSAEWARTAGEYVYKLRQMWNQMMQELRNELGEDADVFVQTAQQLQKTSSEIRQATSTRNIVGKAIQVGDAVTRPTNPSADAPKQTSTEESSRYSAWTKPVINPPKSDEAPNGTQNKDKDVS
ncbi:MAG: hypothetical protein CUN55_07100 [Phototrophicales bacterium]|nr:MAG: hypothetical protein CUN55_07100 [Phototrophicales bacterium]